MPIDSLPTHVDPMRLADHATSLHGLLPIKNMSRLVQSLYKDEGVVDVKLLFDIDKQGIRFIKTDFKTQLVLQCQRCMESYVYETMGGSALGIVTSEVEAATLPSYYEPIVVLDGQLLIQDLIEDELLIGLPIVPMHEPEDCKVVLPFVVADDPQVKDAAKKENPFKVIESLRTKPKQE